MLVTWVWSSSVVHAQSGSAPESAGDSPSGEGELSPRVALETARSYYEAGRYTECEEAYEDLFAPDASTESLGAEELVEARLFYAACLIAGDHVERADDQMRAAVLIKPQLSAPDPLVFPREVIDRYVAVRASLLDELREREREKVRKARAEKDANEERALAMAARLRQLEEIAAHETVIKKNERWIAAIPFGVGQFQNESSALGWTFLATETVLGGGALISAMLQLGLHSQASQSTTPIEKEEFDRTVKTLHEIQVWGTLGFLTVATLGIVEAQMSYVPERRLPDRPRPLPPPPAPRQVSMRPLVAPLAGGGVVGVVGQF